MKTAKNLKSALAALLILFTAAQAQFLIRGFVVGAANGEPLPVANVIIKDSPRGASTNLDGYFVIDDLTPGVYKLNISYLGYHTKQEEVVVTNEIMSPITIELYHDSFTLEEVVVEVAEADEMEIRLSPQVSTVPLNNMTLRRLPSLGAEQDVLRTLQTVPGVKASSDISSAIYVRGGSPDQTLILMDHNPVYNPSHMFGLFSTFNADAVKHIELIKGGFPAEYGGRSGSVLEVITEEGNRKEMEGMVNIGIISAKGSVQGPLPNDKGSYFLAGRRTYMDPILAAMREAYDTDLPDYYFYDYNGKVNWDLSDETTLTVAGYWGSDHLDFEVGPSDSRIHMGLTWGNRTLSARLRHVVSPRMFLSVGAAVSRYRSKWIFENEDVVFEDAYDRLFDYSLKSDLEYFPGSNHKIKTGIWISRYNFTLNMGSPEVTWVDIDDGTFNYSYYFQDKWSLTPQWEIQPGVRMYYHESGDYFMVDPRFAVLYSYDADTRFKLSTGRYSQFIDLITFGEGMSNFDIWAPVDETMDPTYADQIVVGFEHEPRKNLHFTFESYYTDMKNLAAFNSLTIEQSLDGGDAYMFGDGFAYGFEWMLRKTQGRLTGWLGYSLSWTQRKFADTYQNNGMWYYPKWDRRHDFVAVGYYDFNHRWDFSGSWRYNTGQGFSQALGMMNTGFAGVDPGFVWDKGRIPVYGEMNNYRFPADHRLDVTATYKHKFFGLPARLNLSVYNVYNRRSYWMRVVDTSENPTDFKDIKLLPVLPMFSYEVRF